MDKFEKFAKNNRISDLMCRLIALEKDIKEDAAYSGFINFNKKDIVLMKEALTKLQAEVLNAEL